MTGGESVFHRSSFSPVSFSQAAFSGASQAQEQQGRSGYWRLFFYQMQEEALKEASKEKLAEIPLITTRVTKTRKPRVTVSIPRELEFQAPPLRKFEPLPDAPTYLQETWRITQEVRVMISQMTSNMIKLDSGVDEDEEDIELLLLLT